LLSFNQILDLGYPKCYSLSGRDCRLHMYAVEGGPQKVSHYQIIKKKSY